MTMKKPMTDEEEEAEERHFEGWKREQMKKTTRKFLRLLLLEKLRHLQNKFK